MGVVHIARCPEHGFHGQRSECFVCGGELEQVAMVPAVDLVRQESDDPSMEKALRQASEHCSALRGVVVRQLDRLAPVEGEKSR